MRAMTPILIVAVVLAAPAFSAEYRLGERLSQQAAGKANAKSAAIRQINWDDLVPRDWDPRKFLKDIDLGSLNDADPRAMQALEKLREAWNNAPANAEMNGARVRIPGFIVPLEHKGDQIREFLLVPYFGACIHSPPPPSNQVIHVMPPQPLGKSFRTMDAVWVNGTLQADRSRTDMGDAAYRMKAERVEPYKRP